MIIEELINKIQGKRPKKILLQLPDGLKHRAIEIIEEIEKNGIDVVLSGDPCYGACDLRTNEALLSKCDTIVHVGHTKFYKDTTEKVPVIYFPWKMDTKMNKYSLRQEVTKIAESRIGLVTTIQYIDCLDDFFGALESAGKKPVIGGQVLGCWIKNAEIITRDVDAFLFIGSGEFHPLGLAGLNKKIYFYDIEKNELRNMNNEILLMEKRRHARIANAKDAKSFAILVSSKPGQSNLAAAEKIKSALEEKDKNAFIVIMDEIKDEKLLGLKADCFINTACPRLAGDKFSKTIINVEDVKEILG